MASLSQPDLLHGGEGEVSVVVVEDKHVTTRQNSLLLLHPLRQPGLDYQQDNQQLLAGTTLNRELMNWSGQTTENQRMDLMGN